jgi:hypothetical protein
MPQAPPGSINCKVHSIDLSLLILLFLCLPRLYYSQLCVRMDCPENLPQEGRRRLASKVVKFAFSGGCQGRHGLRPHECMLGQVSVFIRKTDI